MFSGFFSRWGRTVAKPLAAAGPAAHRRRDLSWEDLRRFAQGEDALAEARASMILPAVLTVAGAGAAFWWWRSAQTRGELDASAGPEPRQLGAGELDPARALEVGREDSAAADDVAAAARGRATRAVVAQP